MSRLTRGAEERFALLLDGGGAAAAAADPALRSMTLIVGSLRAAGGTVGPPRLDPDARAAMRQRLVAVATVQAVDGVATPRASSALKVSARSRKWAAALAGTVAIATSVSGVAVAASRSLPGDPFYGVKKATEAVQLWTAQGDLAKGKRHLEFARTRLGEARDLPSNSSHLASTLSAMNSQTTQGSRELIAAYQSSKSPAALDDLTTFSEQQYAGLTQLAPTLPPTLRAQDMASIALLQTVVTQVRTVAHGRCILCGAGNSPTVIPPGGQPLPLPLLPTGRSSSRGGHRTTSPTPSSQPTRHKNSTRPSSVVVTPPSIKVSHLPTVFPTHTPVIPLPTLPPNPIISTLLHPHPHPSKTPKPLLTPLPILSTLLGGIGL
jgi:Domain of unknown function (DUF5667)